MINVGSTREVVLKTQKRVEDLSNQSNCPPPIEETEILRRIELFPEIKDLLINTLKGDKDTVKLSEAKLDKIAKKFIHRKESLETNPFKIPTLSMLGLGAGAAFVALCALGVWANGITAPILAGVGQWSATSFLPIMIIAKELDDAGHHWSVSHDYIDDPAARGYNKYPGEDFYIEEIKKLDSIRHDIDKFKKRKVSENE